MSYAFSVIRVKINANGLLPNVLNSTTHRLLRRPVAGHCAEAGIRFQPSSCAVYGWRSGTMVDRVTLEQGFLRILRFYHDSAVAPVLRTPYRRYGISNWLNCLINSRCLPYAQQWHTKYNITFKKHIYLCNHLICFVFKTEYLQLNCQSTVSSSYHECPPPLVSPNCMFIND